MIDVTKNVIVTRVIIIYSIICTYINTYYTLQTNKLQQQQNKKHYTTNNRLQKTKTHTQQQQVYITQIPHFHFENIFLYFIILYN